MLLAIIIGIFVALLYEDLGHFKPFNYYFLLGMKLENTKLYKPLFDCSTCTSGQFALWFIIIYNIESIIGKHLFTPELYLSIFEMIIFILLSIITTIITRKLWKQKRV